MHKAALHSLEGRSVLDQNHTTDLQYGSSLQENTDEAEERKGS